MVPICDGAKPSRRAVLLTAGCLFASAYLPKAVGAAGQRDPRLIVIVLRGALDGMSAVAPVGDPNYATLHGEIALSLSGANAALPLDGFFALNPGMPVFARQFKAGHAAVVHAAATAYRERSHFDGQDVLESGFPGPGLVASGWLNRALGALPAGGRVTAKGGLAVGPVTPLILRGGAPILGWAPETLPAAPDGLADRVMDLYAHRDPMLHLALAQGLETGKMAAGPDTAGSPPKARVALASIAGMRVAAEGAAKIMAADDGPRIAALTFDGWDTHVNEGGATGRLAQLLSGLDGAFDALESGLGDRWKDTAIVAVTEFGRTARINGTAGTDHGTATVAFLTGGTVKGGRVIADWPGLKDGDLYEGRDLKPTTDLRSVLKGLLADQFGLSAATLAGEIFPQSAAVKSMQGLLA